MNNLPQELVDRISSFLDREDLKNTLLLSREFQHAAEQFSGAFSSYALTEDNDSEFLGTYSGRHFRHLRTVEFRTSVPALDWDKEAHSDDEYPTCRDTEDELQLMDEEFTRQIKFLFATLEAVESCASKAYGPGKIELTLYTPTRQVDVEQYCLHRTFTSWRVHLLAPETLPSLTSVRALVAENGVLLESEDEPDPSLRKLDLRVLIDISNKLPNLDELRCKLGGDEWPRGARLEAGRYITHDWAGPRRDSRHDFSKALSAVALPCLRHAHLDFIHPLSSVDWIDQRLALPNLTQPKPHDPFSSSLRLLSHQLRTLNLRVVADETLFWPTDGTVPSWPNLESLSVMFHMGTPSGAWYFNGLPHVGATSGFNITSASYPPTEGNAKDDETDEDISNVEWDESRSRAQFRVEPNNVTLVPLLTGFAKAAAHMPSLKEAAIWSPLIFRVDDVEAYEDFDTSHVSDFADSDLAWGLAYTKPGAEAFTLKPGEDFCSVRQIWWRVAKWRPDAALHRLVQQIGRTEHGEELEEYWDDSYWTGDGLVERECFTKWEGQRWFVDA
jgi:hypothetical protein